MKNLNAVSIFIYGLALMGELLCFYGSLENLYYRLSGKIRLRKKASSGRASSGLSASLELALGIKGERSALYFIVISLALGLTAFSLLYGVSGAGLALCGFAAFSLSPWLLLKARMRNRQVMMSREGEELLTELLNNYRINHFNMAEAIESTALTIENAPLSKKSLLDLSRRLNTASSADDIRAAAERLRLALSTSWGDLLAANIEFAEIDGIRVDESLKDLADVTARAARKLEMTKRENGDSSMIIKVLFPLMCLLIYFGATACFGMSTEEFIRCQFRTSAGLGWAIALGFSYVLSVFVSAFTARQKMDI